MLGLKQHKHVVWPGVYAESFHMVVVPNPNRCVRRPAAAQYLKRSIVLRFGAQGRGSALLKEARGASEFQTCRCIICRPQLDAEGGVGLIHQDRSRSQLYRETSYMWGILKLNGFVVPRTACGEPRVGLLLIYHRGTFTSACRESSRCSWFGAADSGSLSSESRRSWNS